MPKSAVIVRPREGYSVGHTVLLKGWTDWQGGKPLCDEAASRRDELGLAGVSYFQPQVGISPGTGLENPSPKAIDRDR